jgi:hypothetical protein
MLHRVHSHSTSHNRLDLCFLFFWLPFCDKILGHSLSIVSLLRSSIQPSENMTFCIYSVARLLFPFSKTVESEIRITDSCLFFGTNGWFSYLLFVRVYIRLTNFGNI